MTVKQIQCLLAYLGYEPGAVDGVMGAKTRAAVRAFQTAEGLSADGDPGQTTQAALLAGVAKGRFRADTGTFWDGIRYFVREEWRCQCGGKYCDGFPAEPQERLVRICDEIRARLGVPCAIVSAGGSGVRCQRHNAEVGGAANSYHLSGRAADLHSGVSPQRMKQVAESVTAELCPGEGGIGIYDWGIHVDDGKLSRWDMRKG